MPLTWNVSKVKDHSTVCFDGDFKINPVTKTLVYVTESIGVPVITEENQYEFFQRCRIHERINGAFLHESPEADPDDWVERRISLDDVRTHIGLRTNARRLSHSKFRDELWSSLQASAISDQKTEVTLLCSELKISAATPVVP